MNQDLQDDLGRYILPGGVSDSGSPIQKLRGKEVKLLFLRGPILWRWWARAATLRGKSLHVASVIWLLAGLRLTTLDIHLSGKRLKELGVGRCSFYRALAALECAGLISVDRKRGRSPIVSLL